MAGTLAVKGAVYLGKAVAETILIDKGVQTVQAAAKSQRVRKSVSVFRKRSRRVFR